MTTTVKVNCNVCGKVFERPVQKGRPALRCPECRNGGAIASPLEQKKLSAEDSAIIINENLEASDQQKPNDIESDYPQLFRLMVGNLGLAYAGESQSDAFSKFNSYANKSNMGFGQVGFEIVQLWKLDREQNRYGLEKEFLPPPRENSIVR